VRILSSNFFALLLVSVFAVPALSLFLMALDAETEIWAHLSSTVFPVYLRNSLLLLVGVGAGTLMLGVVSGFLTALFEFPGRRWLEWMLMLPMAMPAYILAMVYLELLEYSGTLQSALRDFFSWKTPADYWFPEIASIGGAVLMLSLVLYPYVYLLSRNAFQQQSPVFTEAGRLLGDRTRYGLWKIALPMARPAVAVGVSLALMEALADFGTVQLFSVPTFTTGIYHIWFGTANAPAAAQLSLSLLGFVGLLIALERFSRRQQRFHGKASSLRRSERRPLPNRYVPLAQFFCLLPVFLGFFLPGWMLLHWSWQSFSSWNAGRFISDASNSLLLAGITSLLALAVAMLLNFGIRLPNRKMLKGASRLASLGYAFPGPVIALGVLMPLSWFDQHFNQWLNAEGQTGTYWLSGTIFVLIYAYLIRFLALAQGSVESGMASITPQIEDSGRMLGSPQGKVLRDLYLPMLRGSLWTGGLLVFVDVMKELPATLMLQPFNTSTLATRAFAYASEEMLKEAAPWCLAIVMTGLLPVIMLNRKLRSSAIPVDTSHRLMPVPPESQLQPA
jgi:iron(III) transport system permease protein